MEGQRVQKSIDSSCKEVADDPVTGDTSPGAWAFISALLLNDCEVLGESFLLMGFSSLTYKTERAICPSHKAIVKITLADACEALGNPALLLLSSMSLLLPLLLK